MNNSLVESLDVEIEGKSLLKHQFYTMWTEGKLSRKHLAGYSMEYFQLVKAVPELVKNIGEFVVDAPTRKVVSDIVREETEHVELWAKFASSLGVSREALLAYAGTPKTKEAVARLRSATMESFCKGAAAMYAIESEQPKISRTKLDGLVAFYGMGHEDDSTVYFREHEVADVRHAAVWAALLQREAAGGEEDENRSQEASAMSMVAQNAILDSVMETYVAPSLE